MEKRRLLRWIAANVVLAASFWLANEVLPGRWVPLALVALIVLVGIVAHLQGRGHPLEWTDLAVGAALSVLAVLALTFSDKLGSQASIALSWGSMACLSLWAAWRATRRNAQGPSDG